MINVMAVEPLYNETSKAPDTKDQQAYPKRYYDNLRQKVYVGKATVADIHKLLAEPNQYGLTNTMHVLYAMRTYRNVFVLLEAMWEKRVARYPDWNWDAISQPPVSIALASTLNRIKIAAPVYQDYIRSYLYDSNEFTRAQVAMALGFNGRPGDIPYLREMIKSDNNYVAQTAIIGLAAMGGELAKNTLLILWEQYQDGPRGRLLSKMLKEVYQITVYPS